MALQALGCGPGEHEGHVRGLVSAKKDSIKDKKSLMEELAHLHGRELAEKCHKQGLHPDRFLCLMFHVPTHGGNCRPNPRNLNCSCVIIHMACSNVRLEQA